MRLVDRYLLRELLIPLSYCLSGFLIFWISFDLFSELHSFQEKNTAFRDIVWYYLIKMPELLTVVMPIALLLALLYALTNHARHNELLALRGAGLSFGRLSLPYLGVGLVFSLALFALNELWVPQSVEAAEELLYRNESAGPVNGRGRWHTNLNFRNSRDGRFWTIGAFNLDTYEMRNPHVSWQLPDQTQRSLIATNAVRTNGCWVFYGVQEFTYRITPESENTAPSTNLVDVPDFAETPERFKRFESNVSRTNVLVIPEFSEMPEQFKSEIKISRLRGMKAAKEAHFSISEIINYLRLNPDLNQRDSALLRTQLHARLAWPWTCLVVVLIALPFGAASGRRNAFVGVASSIFICFAFFILFRFGLALGTSGSAPPWLAAWLPHILFSAAGIGLAARVR